MPQLRSRLAIFGTLSMLAFTACSRPSGIDMNAASNAPATYKTNPAPKQAYRITMTIKDAPGPFGSMKALAQYDVVNKECLSPPKDNPGGTSAPVPTEDVEIPLEKTGENTYVGTVYADHMLDEDYTGRGACHWALMQFRVHMKATGADGETLFIPSIQDKALLAQGEQTIFFNKISYPRSEIVDNYPYTGAESRSIFNSSVRDEDLFTVSFTSRKDATP